MKMKMKMKKKSSHGYDINRPKFLHEHEYSLSMMMLICIKQHLRIWSSVMKKLSNTEAELKNRVAYKKARHCL